MEIERIKFILWAVEMDRAMQFWTGCFGLTTVFATEHWSELDLGGCHLALHGGHDGSVKPSGFSIQVKGLDQALVEIADCGGTIVKPPVRPEGEPVRIAEVRDPEGNEFMVTEYVG